MALLVMACWDTIENKRSSMTDRCLASISKTVDLASSSSHRLIVVDNGSCFATTETLQKWRKRLARMSIIWNKENVGQAKAINQGWMLRHDGEHIVRFDNDVEFLTPGWPALLEACVDRDPTIGIVAGKHPDLEDCPEADGWLKTSYHTVPHKKGLPHIIVERMRHCLGSVQLISSALLAKIGYLRQYGLWGAEDVDYCTRCQLAGFQSVYVHGLYFNDLDSEKVESYQTWKDETAAKHMPEMDKTIAEYKNGTRPLYVEAS